MNVIVCDKCNHEFELKIRETKTEKYLIRFFRCPECKTISLCYVEDKAVKKCKELYASGGITKEQLAMAELKAKMNFLKEMTNR